MLPYWTAKSKKTPKQKTKYNQWILCKYLLRGPGTDLARVALASAFFPRGVGATALGTREESGTPNVLAQGLDLVREGKHVVRLLLCLVAEVVVPRTSDRLMDVSVSRGVQDLRQRHPAMIAHTCTRTCAIRAPPTDETRAR